MINNKHCQLPNRPIHYTVHPEAYLEASLVERFNAPFITVKEIELDSLVQWNRAEIAYLTSKTD